MTVVIPVYNPGPYLQDCIDSLLRQSLPPEEFEAIFVDDGSTDDSPARLDALAAEHPHMRVIHQGNSGWSGKPRNVGVAHACGEYVFFVDNDDYLGDEALERMYKYAKEHGSDVVVGKMAGKGRGVPRELFRKNHPDATLGKTPLIDSLTPHKMFRKAFLDAHGLRFPEGRRRLEDHVFVTAAYFAAQKVSVLSNYICYYHVRRDDSSNAAYQQIDWRKYFANLSEALDIVEANTEPGPLRDKLHRRWYRVEMIERLRGSRLLRMPEVDRRALFDEVHRLSAERFAPGVAAGMAPAQRIVSRLVQAGRLDDLIRLAEWEEDIHNHVRLDDLGWHDGALQFAVTAELRTTGEPMTFTHRGGRDLLTPPLTAEALAALSPDDLDSTMRLAQTKVDVVLRAKSTSAEHFVPATSAIARYPVGASDVRAYAATMTDSTDTEPVSGETFRPVVTCEAHIDIPSVVASTPLSSGIWDVVARISCCGWTKDARIGAVKTVKAAERCIPAIVGEPARMVTPHWTDRGNLSIEVGEQCTVKRDMLVPAEPVLVGPHPGFVVTLPLRILTTQARSGAVMRLLHEGTDRTIDLPAELSSAVAGGASNSTLTVKVTDRLDPGRYSVAIRLAGTTTKPATPPTSATPARAGDGTASLSAATIDAGFIGLTATLTVPEDAGMPVVDVLAPPGDPDGFLTGHAELMARFLRTRRRLARRVRKTLGLPPVSRRGRT
ncbi:glycosyltransferase family A protein [Actinopolymorpha sp. B11F2]|uniref:glycosyltransferase family 2 protein n=1 Tax=Actinopolymorpha sp. B11F2 TaxID=3160862 RepID=UPI0032E50966